MFSLKQTVNISEVFHFKTLPPPPSPRSFFFATRNMNLFCAGFPSQIFISPTICHSAKGEIRKSEKYHQNLAQTS